MFCTECGTKAKEGAAYCENCGKKLPFSNEIGGQPPSGTAQARVGTHPYHKLGGWLAFLTYGQLLVAIIIALDALASIGMMVQYAKYLGFTAILMIFVLIIVYIPAFYLSVKLFLMIRSKNPLFLRYYEMTMLVYGGIEILLTLIGVFTKYWSAAEHFKALAEAVIFFVIWMAYFKKSVRVRTYFGTDAYLKKSLFLNYCEAPDPAD